MAYLRQDNIFERSGIGGFTDTLVDHFPTPGWSASNMQRGFGRGMGAYENPGDWSWEFFPPPYDFLAPKNAVAMPAPILLTPNGVSGLSGCGCGCGGKGTCGHTHGGLGGGLGLFDSMDFSQWGIGEWGTVAFGVYVLSSLLGDIGRGRRKVKRVVSRSRKAKRDQLERQLAAAA